VSRRTPPSAVVAAAPLYSTKLKNTEYSPIDDQLTTGDAPTAGPKCRRRGGVTGLGLYS